MATPEESDLACTHLGPWLKGWACRQCFDEVERDLALANTLLTNTISMGLLGGEIELRVADYLGGKR